MLDQIREGVNSEPTFSSGALPDSPQLEEAVASATFHWDEPLSDDELEWLAREAEQLPLPFVIVSQVVPPNPAAWGKAS